jgi:hypothetical protein
MLPEDYLEGSEVIKCIECRGRVILPRTKEVLCSNLRLEICYLDLGFP